MNRPNKWKLWLVLLYIQATVGLYHEPSIKSFRPANITDDSYFGYSITYQVTTKRLIVGAPMANVVGQVYTIDVDGGIVTPLPTPQILLDRANTINSTNPSQKKFLLGASVKAGSNYFVMCAPRHNKNYRDRDTRLYAMGLCFVSPTGGNVSLIDNDDITYNKILKPYGWSLDITGIDMVIVGAPAGYQGIVKVVKNGEYKEINVPRHFNGTSFGYSVTSGNYFDADNLWNFYYVSSTPTGIIGLGEVYFFDSKKLHEKYYIKNHILNSLFGASLCTVNLGDRCDSLLIGAPTYKGDVQTIDYDRGAVYLYVPNTSGKKMVKHKIIEGQSNGAYFGYSIINLGDMDGDRRDEVAIGAPYEDNGRGAVYIYSGAGLRDPKRHGDQMLIQRIQPEPNSKLLSFGHSLTILKDYDENGCQELAVGAPESNVVILYRCFSYIIIKLQAKFPTKSELRKNRQEDKFNFQSCIDVIFPEKPKQITEKLLVQVKIAHQDAWLSATSNTITNELTYELSINQNQSQYCNDVKVMTRKNGNFEALMSYTISASLVNDPLNMPVFNSSRVTLSKQSSVLSVVGQESLADCDGPCEPVLSIQFKPNMSNLYIVGSTSEGTFAFSIHNEGDTAYTACLQVKIKGAPLLRPPKGCTTENGIDLTCKPTALLKENWVTGDIALDTSGLTSKDEEITVSYKLYNPCNNKIEAVVSHEQNFILISDIEGITLQGESDPDGVVDVFSESLRSRHIYTITHSGLTNWEGVSADIVMTKIENVHFENIYLEVEDENPVLCKTVNETENKINAICDSINLKKGCKLGVIIPFVVSPPIDGVAESQNVTSSMKLYLKKDILVSNVMTELRFKKSTVHVWMFIAGGFIGLALLAIFSYILCSYGCLKRKKKGELKKLKKSVDLQSKVRRSMRCRRQDKKEEENIIPESENIAEEQE